ncbi:hypothetical protein EYF80_052972 [Liparis tanakae]|uniref:Uncharacterized protein n=1 Tax=Liparis tanakae TaxID=230148 RepID=A0A4Z2F7S7_9TELE|nr:hypothetical protein EYF80_052972 [Liparis tanakae]
MSSRNTLRPVSFSCISLRMLCTHRQLAERYGFDALVKQQQELVDSVSHLRLGEVEQRDHLEVELAQQVEHSIASDIWTDILGAFSRGQSNVSLIRRKQLDCHYSIDTFTVGRRTDHNVDFVGPHSLRAAADLTAIPAVVILRRVRNLKRK